MHGIKDIDLFPDPARDKEKFKQQISEAISRRNPGVRMSEVRSAVNEHYENMLSHAVVTRHIPSLVENELRRELRLRADEDLSDPQPVETLDFDGLEINPFIHVDHRM